MSVVSCTVIYSNSVQLGQHIVQKAEACGELACVWPATWRYRPGLLGPCGPAEPGAPCAPPPRAPLTLIPLLWQVRENGLSCGEPLNRCIRWADAVVIVFSVTDYQSYELIGQLHQHVQQLHLGSRLPVVVVANKADLLHVKQVDPQLGLQLASMLGCSFYEVSVSENYNDVYNAFHVLCKEVSHKQQPSGTPEKRRTSLIPRPKSPNMQDLKRRFKQALSAKVRTVTSV